MIEELDQASRISNEIEIGLGRQLRRNDVERLDDGHDHHPHVEGTKFTRPLAPLQDGAKAGAAYALVTVPARTLTVGADG